MLLYPKAGYLAAGVPDYEIALELLRRKLAAAAPGAAAWRVVELRGLRHREVARLMRESAFLVSLNSMEAFNTTVPEAMAAGCVPLCYDAYGGQDYLRPGVDAYVFPNHHLFPLLERLFELMDGYELRQSELARLRRGGRETAQRFREAPAAAALQRLFTDLVGNATPAGTVGAR